MRPIRQREKTRERKSLCESIYRWHMSFIYLFFFLAAIGGKVMRGLYGTSRHESLRLSLSCSHAIYIRMESQGLRGTCVTHRSIVLSSSRHCVYQSTHCVIHKYLSRKTLFFLLGREYLSPLIYTCPGTSYHHQI